MRARICRRLSRTASCVYIPTRTVRSRIIIYLYTAALRVSNGVYAGTIDNIVYTPLIAAVGSHDNLGDYHGRTPSELRRADVPYGRLTPGFALR